MVVATHGGPTQRQPDISEHDLRQKFGDDTIRGFYHIDSKPDENGRRRGIEQLNAAIARVAVDLPHVGRQVPASWAAVLEAVRRRSERDPYVTYKQFRDLCRPHKVSDERAALYASMLNELGYVIHSGQDEGLREVVILKSDWLAKAISFVLDDKTTRDRHGLVDHDHLSRLWSHPPYPGETGYPAPLHPLFRRLMERFDLSYEVVLHPGSDRSSNTSLIAQLVPADPLALTNWDERLLGGDDEQTQICRIVAIDGNESANAEGLFYRLIVRLRNEYFRTLAPHDRRIMSQVDGAFSSFMQAFADEARDGPRLFSFIPVEPGFFDRPNSNPERFQFTLWCEHARLPLPVLNGEGDQSGVYELELAGDWLGRLASFLKSLSTTLSLALPVASSASRLLVDDAAYDRITDELDFGQRFSGEAISMREEILFARAFDDGTYGEHSDARLAGSTSLRELHTLLKRADPSGKFGGLVRVQNKRREFLWVHPQFGGEY